MNQSGVANNEQIYVWCPSCPTAL